MMRDFVPIDQILQLTDGTFKGRKGFSGREEYFEKHFTNNPVVPGTYLLEAMCECIRWWTEIPSDFSKTIQVRRIENAKFTHMVRPGQLVDVAVALDEEDGWLRTFAGECSLGLARVGTALLTIGMIDVSDPAYPTHRREVLRFLAAESIWGKRMG